MNQELANLILLQKIDNDIKDIKSLAGDLPAKVTKKEQRIEDLEKTLDGIENEIISIEQEIRKLNSMHEDSQVKLDKYKEQLYLVKSNKEYDALNNEIDHIKNLLSENQEKLVELEIQKEDKIGSRDQSKSEFNDLVSHLAKDKDQLQSALHSSEEDLKKLDSNKNDLLKKIDGTLLSHYNELLGNRGSAVVPLNSNCCGNCFSVLPPQMIVEIKLNTEINSCTSCGVYLYYEEE